MGVAVRMKGIMWLAEEGRGFRLCGYEHLLNGKNHGNGNGNGKSESNGKRSSSSSSSSSRYVMGVRGSRCGVNE